MEFRLFYEFWHLLLSLWLFHIWKGFSLWQPTIHVSSNYERSFRGKLLREIAFDRQKFYSFIDYYYILIYFSSFPGSGGGMCKQWLSETSWSGIRPDRLVKGFKNRRINTRYPLSPTPRMDCKMGTFQFYGLNEGFSVGKLRKRFLLGTWRKPQRLKLWGYNNQDKENSYLLTSICPPHTYSYTYIVLYYIILYLATRKSITIFKYK